VNRFIVGVVVAAIATPILHAYSQPLFHAAISWPVSVVGGLVLGFGGWCAWFWFVDGVEDGGWW
jgi:hypothetical protein